MPQRRMTYDEALNIAQDFYLDGLIDQPVSSWATVAEVEAALARWNVKISEA